VPVIIGVAESFVKLRDSVSVLSDVNSIQQIYLRYPNVFFKILPMNKSKKSANLQKACIIAKKETEYATKK